MENIRKAQTIEPTPELWEKAREIVKSKGFLWTPYISGIVDKHCKKIIKKANKKTN